MRYRWSWDVDHVDDDRIRCLLVSFGDAVRKLLEPHKDVAGQTEQSVSLHSLNRNKWVLYLHTDTDLPESLRIELDHWVKGYLEGYQSGYAKGKKYA